jgi:hypothetical protein
MLGKLQGELRDNIDLCLGKPLNKTSKPSQIVVSIRNGVKGSA